MHPTSYYLELARKSDLFSEAIDVDLSPVSSPRRPSVSRDHVTLEPEDPFLRHRLKESGKRVTSMLFVPANDNRIVVPASPPLTPVTEPQRTERDKFLLSGANRILSRSARNSGMPGATRSNDDFKEVDYSMMETIKYNGPSTSEEWPQAMPIYLKKKVLAHNPAATDVTRSATDDAVPRKASKVTRVKSAPDMSASIRRASLPREAPSIPHQSVSNTAPTGEQIEQSVPSTPSDSQLDTVDVSTSNTAEQSSLGPTTTPQSTTVIATHITSPPVPMRTKSQKTIARPPPPTSPRPLSIASKTNAVTPTPDTESASEVTAAPSETTPLPSAQAHAIPSVTHAESVATVPSTTGPTESVPVTAVPVDVTHNTRQAPPQHPPQQPVSPKISPRQVPPPTAPQATDSLPPVKLGHALVTRSSLPKKPAPPGSSTLRHVTSADSHVNATPVPKSPLKVHNNAPPKVPSPKLPPPNNQAPLKKAPAPAKKKFGPAPVKQL